MIGFIFNNWKLVLSVIFGLAFAVWHYKATLEENKRLSDEISRANVSINALNEKMDAENKINTQVNELKKNLKGKEDGAVAPVLDSTLDALDGLR